MENKKKETSIVKKMILAVAGGFIAGFLCLLLREVLNGSGNDGVWKVIDAILFQDITATQGIEGLGLFFIIGQLFMRGLQMAIVPLVITSLTLALCSLANPEKLGRIAGKTFITYLCFYVVAATLAGAAAYFVKSMGWFDVNLPGEMATEAVTMDGYNPLVTVVNAVPSNIVSACSTNNTILSVVVIAIILGLCMTAMGAKADPLKKVIENLNDVVQMFLNFLPESVNHLGEIFSENLKILCLWRYVFLQCFHPIVKKYLESYNPKTLAVIRFLAHFHLLGSRIQVSY